LGKNIVFLNEAEAAKVAAVNDKQVDRPWDLWKGRALSSAQQK
jgi:hypothetical protein